MCIYTYIYWDRSVATSVRYAQYVLSFLIQFLEGLVRLSVLQQSKLYMNMYRFEYRHSYLYMCVCMYIYIILNGPCLTTFLFFSKFLEGLVRLSVLQQSKLYIYIYRFEYRASYLYMCVCMYIYIILNGPCLTTFSFSF